LNLGSEWKLWWSRNAWRHLKSRDLGRKYLSFVNRLTVHQIPHIIILEASPVPPLLLNSIPTVLASLDPRLRPSFGTLVKDGRKYLISRIPLPIHPLPAIKPHPSNYGLCCTRVLTDRSNPRFVPRVVAPGSFHPGGRNSQFVDSISVVGMDFSRQIGSTVYLHNLGYG
jgi:hypothetical protein